VFAGLACSVKDVHRSLTLVRVDTVAGSQNSCAEPEASSVTQLSAYESASRVLKDPSSSRSGRQDGGADHVTKVWHTFPHTFGPVLLFEEGTVVQFVSDAGNERNISRMY
jgi:hypothetical protein